jgi:hypothetical protein
MTTETLIGNAIKGCFHLVPLAIAAKVWWEHEKFKKEVHKKASKLDIVLDHVDQNTNMTFTILKLLLFITLYVSIDTFTTLTSIHADTAENNENTKKILDELTMIRQIKSNTDLMVTCYQFPCVDSIRNKFNPVLAKTFSAYIDEYAAFCRDGITQGKISFYMDRFPTAYINSLDYLTKKYPDSHATILATSLPSAQYFWSYGKSKLKPTELKIKKFIAQGGIVKRIFFVEDNYQKDPVVMSILNRQKDSMHVNNVYILNNKYVRKPKYFVVNKEKEFVWDVIISNKERIDYGTYFTKKEDIEEYLKMYTELENNPNLQEFRKGD